MTAEEFDSLLLAGILAPFQPHSATSKAAAKAIEPKAGTLLSDVLACLRNWPKYGLTDEQIQSSLAMSGDTQRPRRIELVRAGLVKDSGRTRKTSSGADAVVWVAV